MLVTNHKSNGGINYFLIHPEDSVLFLGNYCKNILFISLNVLKKDLVFCSQTYCVSSCSLFTKVRCRSLLWGEDQYCTNCFIIVFIRTMIIVRINSPQITVELSRNNNSLIWRRCCTFGNHCFRLGPTEHTRIRTLMFYQCFQKQHFQETPSLFWSDEVTIA